MRDKRRPSGSVGDGQRRGTAPSGGHPDLQRVWPGGLVRGSELPEQSFERQRSLTARGLRRCQAGCHTFPLGPDESSERA